MKILAITMVLAMLTIGCGKNEQKFGEAPSSGTKKVSLSQVLESPDQFHQKDITLQGIVDGQCGSRCEFFYREGNDAIPIYMGSIEAPIITKGTPVTVTASVHKGNEKVILTAKGFTLKPKGEK